MQDTVARRAPPLRQRLGPHDLAFFRAVHVENIDPIDAARAYLPGRPTARVAARHLKWVRRELLVTARRHDELKRAARVIARPLPPAPAEPAGRQRGPTLDELHERYPDFSERELLEQLAALDPTPIEEQRRHRRMTARRLRAVTALRLALDLLERYTRFVAPSPADPVQFWFAEPVARALASAGVASLADLVQRIDARGFRWFAAARDLGPVRGIGPERARQIGAWLNDRVPDFHARIGQRALMAPRELRPALREARSPAAAITPLEWFQPPDHLSGYDAPNRLQKNEGGLPAVDDRHAIQLWLLRKLNTAQAQNPVLAERNVTFRTYRREVERVWLWAVLVRGKALSALDDGDAEAFRTFLFDPQPRADWIGPRRERWHPEWRPFTAPPSPAVRELTMTVVGSLFAWWQSQGYIRRDPFKTGSQLEPVERPQFSRRALSLPAWERVRASVAAMPNGEAKHRLRALLALFYSAGPRRAEVAAATIADLQATPGVDGSSLWELSVVGKRRRARLIPLPAPVMEALLDYFEARFGDRSVPVAPKPAPGAASRPPPLFANLRHRTREAKPLGAWGINASIQTAFLAAASSATDDADLLGPGAEKRQLLTVAKELREASAHWLRHTFATHALKHDQAELAIVSQILGHADIRTTAKNYIDADAELRQRVAQKAADRARI